MYQSYGLKRYRVNSGASEGLEMSGMHPRLIGTFHWKHCKSQANLQCTDLHCRLFAAINLDGHVRLCSCGQHIVNIPCARRMLWMDVALQVLPHKWNGTPPATSSMSASWRNMTPTSEKTSGKLLIVRSKCKTT